MKIRGPVKIHGGKYYVKNFILEHFCENYTEMTYCECYGGAANVLLNKKPSTVEIYNDLDASLTEIFYYLKYHSKDFIDLLDKVDYNEETFKKSLEPATGIQAAINELVARRMSRGGLKKSFSWSNRKRGGHFGDVNAWLTFKQNHLPEICERLQNVTVLNKKAIDVIQEYDSDKVLFYLDPPYVPATRTISSVYQNEMTEKDHKELAKVLQDVKGKVILSGYYSPLYAKLYNGWPMAVKEFANHASQSKKKQRRLECLWTNY